MVTLFFIALLLFVAVFSLMNAEWAYEWGFIPVSEFKRKLISSFTSCFVHVDPVHLLGNLIFLAAVGPAVERVVSWWRFILVFMMSGVFGMWFHGFMVVASQPAIAEMPVIGASGAIAGLIGYSFLRFYRHRVPLLPAVKIPVILMISVWLIFQVGGGIWAQYQLNAPLAFWAHIGGFVLGFLMGFVFRAEQHAKEEAWQDRLGEAKTHGYGTQAGAVQEYLKKKPNSPKELKDLSDSLMAMGDEEGALESAVRSLELDAGFGGGWAVHRILELDGASEIHIENRIQIAKKIMRDAPDASEKLLMSVLEEGESKETPESLALLVEVIAPNDPDTARYYANRLRREYGNSPQYERIAKNWSELFLY